MASLPNDTSHVHPNPEKIAYKVAVIGGGICGLALTIGLLKYEHIDVQIYEAAPSFGEIGAGITVGPNAQRALELIGPEAEAAFAKHKTPNFWASHKNDYTWNIVGYGPHEGEIICKQSNQTGMLSVHRARFLGELVKPIPTQRCHFGKRLVHIEDEGEDKPLTLWFKDGTSDIADAVIGADGVHSTVRRYLLGEDHPAAKPQYTGTVSYRGVVPIDRAIEKVGAEYAQNSMMLCGPEWAFFSYPIEHGADFNLVLMHYNEPEWHHEKWIVPTTMDKLRPRFEGWGEKLHALLDLLDSPDLSAWAMWDHPAAPFYNKGRVVIVGDAAHATTPYQGQGAAQAIEDALVLKVLLGAVKSKEHIADAFAAYDQVRRPRSQRTVTTSRESGRLLGWMEPGIGNDLAKLKKRFETRMHWLWFRDLNAQNEAALKLFRESL